MKIIEAYSPEDRVIAKLRNLQTQYTTKCRDIERFINDVHVCGNLRTKTMIENMIDDLLASIELSLTSDYEDDLLVIFREDTLRNKDKLVKLRNSL